jgi:hypothetical protein
MALSRVIKQNVKRLLFAAAPQTATALFSARARAHSHQLVKEWGLESLNRKLVAHLGWSVVSGPFAGMTLSPSAAREHLGPFLLGTYEFELHAWLAALLRGRFSQVIDVGAKFGYYAVGFARAFPSTPVVAFDTDWWARRATMEVARANSVENRLSIQAYCSPRRLGEVLSHNALVISDCEGYEGELFAAPNPRLASATLVIELHEAASPGVTDAIRNRFARTHNIESVSTTSVRHPPAPVDLSFLSPEEAKAAMTEVRLPQEWLLLTPR